MQVCFQLGTHFFCQISMCQLSLYKKKNQLTAFLRDSETLPWPLVDFKTLVKTFNSHTYGFLSVDQRAYQKSVELQV